MLTGFWKLTWVETKVFMREPMGVFGSLGVPLLFFFVFGRLAGLGDTAAIEPPPFNVPVIAALFVAIGAVISLVAIMSIYREGGILKRMRATPLSPVTILSAHVFVKLVFTVIGLILLVLAGRSFFPGAMQVDLVSFTTALVLSTLSILSMGFVIAAVVPTARFAQPVSAAFLYPMVVFSGAFFPLEGLPTAARSVIGVLPTTHATSLMLGVWEGGSWVPHLDHVFALLLAFAAFTALSAKVFRWE